MSFAFLPPSLRYSISFLSVSFSFLLRLSYIILLTVIFSSFLPSLFPFLPVPLYLVLLSPSSLASFLYLLCLTTQLLLQTPHPCIPNIALASFYSYRFPFLFSPQTDSPPFPLSLISFPTQYYPLPLPFSSFLPTFLFCTSYYCSWFLFPAIADRKYRNER